MFQSFQILPLFGFKEISFGSTPTHVKSLLGEALEESILDDEFLNQKKQVWHYPKLGLSFFFTLEPKLSLCSIECSNKATELFKQKVMDLDEKQFLNLMKENSYTLSDREQLPWGEICFSFDEIELECYFQNKKMQALSFSQKPK